MDILWLHHRIASPLHHLCEVMQTLAEEVKIAIFDDSLFS